MCPPCQRARAQKRRARGDKRPRTGWVDRAAEGDLAGLAGGPLDLDPVGRVRPVGGVLAALDGGAQARLWDERGVVERVVGEGEGAERGQASDDPGRLGELVGREMERLQLAELGDLARQVDQLVAEQVEHAQRDELPNLAWQLAQVVGAEPQRRQLPQREDARRHLDHALPVQVQAVRLGRGALVDLALRAHRHASGGWVGGAAWERPRGRGRGEWGGAARVGGGAEASTATQLSERTMRRDRASGAGASWSAGTGRQAACSLN